MNGYSNHIDTAPDSEIPPVTQKVVWNLCLANSFVC